jgi:hypothetical protein
LQSANHKVGLAAQTQPGGSVQRCQAEGECRQAVPSHVDANDEQNQRQSSEHEAQELREPRGPCILECGWCSDPRPDETGVDLRPQRPLKTDERGEGEHGNLGGEQSETQWSSNVNDEKYNGENDGGCSGAESREARIDVGAERTRAKCVAGHEALREGGRTDPTQSRPSQWSAPARRRGSLAWQPDVPGGRERPLVMNRVS